MKNAEKHLFWLPLHDKDSTKQGFGSHASRIPYFVLYFVNLHSAWPGDPKSSMTGELLLRQAFPLYQTPLWRAKMGRHSDAVQVLWMDFKWIIKKNR